MEKIIKCIAIDDEPLALDVIKKFCERLGGIELTTYSDPIKGFEAIKAEKPAIAFLDIEMDNINGLDIAAQLPKETCFIFTTAYLDYALKGFDLDAVDYLHKPFAYARFRTAVEKAMRRLDIQEMQKRSGAIVVKQEYNSVSIPLSDILYIEAMEGYVKIFHTDGKCTLSRVILKNIGSQLPEADFIRIHRSYIVRKDQILNFNKKEVVLNSGKNLPIGRQYALTVSSLLAI